MIIPFLRQSSPAMPLTGQRKSQRGASRPDPKKSIIESVKAFIDTAKIAFWLVIAVVVAVLAYNLVNKTVGYVNQPIAKVNVLGDLDYIDHHALKSRIEPFVSAGFLDFDIEKLRIQLEKTPWISHVEVQRVWPNQVNINLYGKHPVARWGDNSLLNNTGDPFVTKNIEAYNSLPLLSGPNYAQQQVMQQYQIISQLLRPLELSIVSLNLTDRGSWSLVTNSGLELILGSDDQVNKIRRFTKAYESDLKNKMDNIARVDLRYANGLAVAWRDPSKEIDMKIVARQ